MILGHCYTHNRNGAGGRGFKSRLTQGRNDCVPVLWPGKEPSYSKATLVEDEHHKRWRKCLKAGHSDGFDLRQKQ